MGLASCALHHADVALALLSSWRRRCSSSSYRDRARTLKHSGDARTRVHPKPLPASAESLRSLVELTDSVLLWVYAFWCDDQLAPSKVNLEMWRSMDGMKKAVRDLWEGIVRSSRGCAGEESAKAMLGLW